MKEKIVVLYGGESVEHDISIITALQAVKHLSKDEILPIYMDKHGKWWFLDEFDKLSTYKMFDSIKRKTQVTLLLGEKLLLKKNGHKFIPFVNVKSVLNCCHGRIGEDGCVQGIFEASGIPQTSPSPAASALCMDKVWLKDVLKNNNILTPAYLSLNKCTYNQQTIKSAIDKKLGWPVIVKPANLGSSIGISVCRTFEEFNDAVQLAFSFDRKVLVEHLVTNLREFNCAAFLYEEQIFCSNVNEVTNNGKIYTFEDKYISTNVKNVEIDKRLSKKIKLLTEKVYCLLDLKGVVRIDFLYDKQTKKLYINEINTIPGSLAFYLFKDISFDEILSATIKQSVVDMEERQKLVRSFDSDALKIFEEVKVVSKK